MSTLSELFKANDLKTTPQRIAVYNTIKKYEHASTDMIIETVKKQYPSISSATVYNILESLTEKNIVKVLLSTDTKRFFDIHTDSRCHLYSPEKGKYQNIEDPALMELIRNYLAEHPIDKFDIEGIELTVTGKFRK